MSHQTGPMRAFLPLALLALAGCLRDETVSGYAEPGAVYRLEAVDDRPARTAFALVFPRPGRAEGQGDCLSFTARQTAPYPWFELVDERIRLPDCVHTQEERAVVLLVLAMTIAEFSGDRLLLSDEAGRALLFRAE